MFNRRNFLKSFGFAGAALGLPEGVISMASPGVWHRNNELVQLQGRVHAAGKGIEGVAVTDGYSVVRTNNKGEYEIMAANAAEFVYISVPSGHAFPNNSGIAAFYKRIKPQGNIFKADFTLEKLSVDDRRHNFVVWADPQINSEADATELKTKSAPDLRALVQSYPKDTLFHGIGCGDLVWDKFELFDDYKEAVATAGIPFFNVIGNHDMDKDVRSDEASSTTFRQHFGPGYYSFNRGDIHYVVLDDVFFIGSTKKYIGYISETQLAWLEKDLAMVKPGSTVVVSVHIPTNTGMARRHNAEENITATVQNRKHLYRLLAPFTTHIMSGHTHVSEKWMDGPVTEHVHGTVCGAWWMGPVCSDGTPCGYGVYEVDGSDIRWYYKGTGLPKEEQIRLYAKGRDAANPESIVANIWNWDAAWKVEWMEDGVTKGLMEQRIGRDPWAAELYKGPQLPEQHKWIEPTLTDHLFYAVPSAGAKEIKVKATDRFGMVYEGKLMMV